MSSITLSDLKTRARDQADMTDSDFISDTELLFYINSSYTELYDILVSSFEDYYVAPPTSFTISAGQTNYTLPTDFYKLRGVDYLVSGSNYLTLPKFNFAKRNQNSLVFSTARRLSGREYRIVGNKLYIEPSESAPGSYRLWYTPSATLLVSDSDTVNGVNGWEEYIVVDTAIKMLAKEESDTSHLERQRARLLERITNLSQNRDYDQPETIADVTSQSEGGDIKWF